MDSCFNFSGALCASARAAGISPENDIFSCLIGSWEVDVVDYDPEGTPIKNHGEWHFCRVLQGWGIQDVWIVPSRESWSETVSEGCRRYGTSLRIFDRENEAWNVFWVNPLTGMENRLIARQEGDKIVQDEKREDGTLIRWTFVTVTEQAFTWRGESSGDGGKTWELEAEFFGRRADSIQTRSPEGDQIRSLLWESPDKSRFEHTRIRETASGFEADGLILRRGDNTVDVRIRYIIRGDASWRVRYLCLVPLNADQMNVELFGDGLGRWHNERGEVIDELEGCIDIDIQASPFTNSIPLRRMMLESGESENISVVFVRIPELEPEPAAQRYTRLPSSGSAVTYRYESRTTGFTADLPTDSDCFLTEYPGFFNRIWRNPGVES